MPEHAILPRKGIGLLLIGCFPCSHVSYPQWMWACWQLTSNAMATRTTTWSTAPRMASPAFPPAVRATVSMEASASTCRMGPAAGTSWCLKIRMIPFATERTGIREKGEWKKMSECPQWVENKDCLLPLQLRPATRGQGDIMPILKMRKLQLREDKKPSKLSSSIQAPMPNPYTWFYFLGGQPAVSWWKWNPLSWV